MVENSIAQTDSKEISKLTPLQLEPMTGSFHFFKSQGKRIIRFSIILLVAGILAHFSGNFGSNSVHEYLAPTSQVSDNSAVQLNSTNLSEQPSFIENDQMDKIALKLQEVKNSFKDSISEEFKSATENVKTLQEMKKIIQLYETLKASLEQAAYWLAFAFAFFLASQILFKIIPAWENEAQIHNIELLAERMEKMRTMLQL